LDRRREREHDEQLRLGVEMVLADEAAVRRAIVGVRPLRNTSIAFGSAHTEMRAEPFLERALELVERVLESAARLDRLDEVTRGIHETSQSTDRHQSRKNNSTFPFDVWISKPFSISSIAVQ